MEVIVVSTELEQVLGSLVAQHGVLLLPILHMILLVIFAFDLIIIHTTPDRRLCLPSMIQNARDGRMVLESGYQCLRQTSLSLVVHVLLFFRRLRTRLQHHCQFLFCAAWHLVAPPWLLATFRCHSSSLLLCCGSADNCRERVCLREWRPTRLLTLAMS
jgi:hypothetical protein